MKGTLSDNGHRMDSEIDIPYHRIQSLLKHGVIINTIVCHEHTLIVAYEMFENTGLLVQQPVHMLIVIYFLMFIYHIGHYSTSIYLILTGGNGSAFISFCDCWSVYKQQCWLACKSFFPAAKYLRVVITFISGVIVIGSLDGTCERISIEIDHKHYP